MWSISIIRGKSHRCNPLAPELMTDISDAYESSYTIMLNLNKSWIAKAGGGFFVESPIVLFTAIIWFFENLWRWQVLYVHMLLNCLIKGMKTSLPFWQVIPIWRTISARLLTHGKGGASEQLQGQIASAKIPLSRLISPQLYWVMSGSDFYVGY